MNSSETNATMAAWRAGLFTVLKLLILLTCGPGALAAPPVAPEGMKSDFLALCDLAVDHINNPARHEPKPVPFYNDSYGVRALAVAYDMTGKRQYLNTCKTWADRMIAYQREMIPKGAYYMNYNRKPGDTNAAWYVADSSSIALGILATAVRCETPAEKQRYLNSVLSFSKLVTGKYIGEAGGVMNGLWPRYGGEWWCSSGIFGSLAFQLYAETGDEKHLQTGLNAIHWLNHIDLSKTKFEFWSTGAPTVVMYVLEAYSTGLPYLPKEGKLREEALAQIRWCLNWMQANQASRVTSCPWDYHHQWGSKSGGLPFHTYIYGRLIPEMSELIGASDAEMKYIASVLKDRPQPGLPQLAVFAMMSYAERVSPGVIYRSSRKTGQ